MTMRTFGFALLGLLTTALLATGQPAAENLDSVLRGWEKAMTDLQSFVCVVERQTLDKQLGARDEHKGYAMFLKPAAKDDGARAYLEMAKVAKPEIFEKYICTGTFLYEYVAANKAVRIHDMPKNNKAAMQESFLSFLFGMTADQAKTRYQMDHVVPNPPDKFYHYLRIRPKMQQDQADFIEARLSLFRENNLPAQIWYLQPNKNEITWNFTKLQLNREIPLKHFEPTLPKDWRQERVLPKALVPGQPVIRN